MQLTNRIFGLDILRALAISIVVITHGKLFLIGTLLENFPWIPLVDGVDFFFVLSGFLIGGIIIKDFNQPNLNFFSLFTFWKRRWFRTLPAYFLILLVNVVLSYFAINSQEFSQFNWKFVFFLHNWNSYFYGFFWESWSLSVEEWFYILLPILVFTISRFVKFKYAFLLSCVVMLIFPIVYRWSISNPELDAFWFDVKIRKIVLCRLDAIAFGLLAAWVSNFYIVSWNRFKNTFFAMAVIGIICLLYFTPRAGIVFNQVVRFSLVPMLIMLLLPLCSSIRNGPVQVVKWVTHISIISYSMYLINLGIVLDLMKKHIEINNAWMGIVLFVIFLVLVVAIASLMYKYFEKPITDLRDR